VSGEFLLDTSALITLIEDEPGAERVKSLLLLETVLLPCTALLETYYITLQEQGADIAEERHALLKRLPATILWEIEEPALLAAARLKAAHRISFADAIVAGFASYHRATLVHKDPEFEALEGDIRLEALPYKKKEEIA